MPKGYFIRKLLSGYTNTLRTDRSNWTTKVIANNIPRDAKSSLLAELLQRRVRQRSLRTL